MEKKKIEKDEMLNAIETLQGSCDGERSSCFMLINNREIVHTSIKGSWKDILAMMLLSMKQSDDIRRLVKLAAKYYDVLDDYLNGKTEAIRKYNTED